MEKKQLAIEINSSRMSAFLVTPGTTVHLHTRTCTGKSESGYRETLHELIAACGNADDFDAFSCSYSDEQHTLVPMMLFGESNPHTLLNLTVHQPVPKEETDYNRVPEWSIVTVYRIPMWVKSGLIVRMPRVVIQHELTHVLRYFNTGSSIPLRTQVILHEHHFCMVVRKDGNIAHASYQAYQSAEDVLYHLLYTFQQLEISTKGEIALHASTQALFETGERIVQLAGNTDRFNQQQMTVHFQEHIQYQTLCV